MKSILSQVLVGCLVGVCSSYPSYPQDGRFFYQVPIQSTHGHLLASLTPQQQQFVQQADPFSQNLYQQPYLQVPGFAAQDTKSKRPVGPVGQQQLLGQQLLGQHQVLYFGAKDGTEEGSTGGTGGGSGAGSGGYVDSFLGLLGSYWPGQTNPPDNTIQPVKPPVDTSVVPSTESKPEKQEKEPELPAPSSNEQSSKYFQAPAVRAPQRHYASPQQFKQPQLADFHREMFDSGFNVGKPGNAAVSFQKMLAAARLKATQAGTKAALAEQDAHSISAEEAKEEHTDDKESSEQDQYGPSIAQAKPQAVSVAGPGGVAAAAPVGTAVVGPGGMALSAPHATAVAGAPKRPQSQDDKLSKLMTRHQSHNLPPSSYFLRY